MHGDLVQRAQDLAVKAHQGQFRRDGVTPYSAHPRAVAAQVADDPVAEAVAWLHDVLEDTAVTEEALRAQGLPDTVISSVRRLTRDPAVPYETYLAAIKADPVARRVKIADMHANLADHPTEKQIEKYRKGLRMLDA